MVKNALLYGSAAFIFLLADILWLGFIAKNFYQASIGPLLLEKPDLGVALLFYALYTLGLVIFVMHGAYAESNIGQAFFYGALFGLFAYATYDLSNLATLKGFPAKLAFVDIAWGAFATSISAGLGVWLTRAILR